MVVFLNFRLKLCFRADQVQIDLNWPWLTLIGQGSLQVALKYAHVNNQPPVLMKRWSKKASYIGGF